MKRIKPTWTDENPVKSYLALLWEKPCVICGLLVIREFMWAIPTIRPLPLRIEPTVAGILPLQPTVRWHGTYGFRGYYACRQCIPTREGAKRWRRENDLQVVNL